MSLTRELQQRMSAVFLFLVEFESNRTGNKRPAFFAGANPLRFQGFELDTSLFAITNRVKSAERNLLPSRKEELLAALHEVLLIESPRIHEILQHDHEHVLCDFPDGKGFGDSAGPTRHSELLSR